MIAVSDITYAMLWFFFQDLKCEVCTFITHLLDSQITRNAITLNVETSTRTLCDLLPTKVKSTVSHGDGYFKISGRKKLPLTYLYSVPLCPK
jgi:hypothetical protein